MNVMRQILQAFAVVLCLFLLPFQAGAQATFDPSLPALFDVTGVASDDTLNIRQTPSGKAAKIGALSPFARNIEVTAVNDSGTWGRINHAEGNGWVSLRYLRRQHDIAWRDAPHGLSCFGTEPFWAADLTADRQSFRFQFFDDPVLDMAVDWRASPENRGAGVFGFAASHYDATAFATLRRATCSDGMSDRLYGLGTEVFITQYGQTRAYQGCCSLSP